MRFRRLLVVLTSCFLLSASALAAQPPPAQGEFVPVNEAALGDKVPAAPLLIAAFAFVWLATMFYVWTIWRRLNTVEREMRALEQKTSQR
jgi:CcmD family protein